MSEYSDRTNCGACGDPVPFGEPHDCWVWSKVQSQETVHPTCPICFEELLNPHWRCEGTEPTTHQVIG